MSRKKRVKRRLVKKTKTSKLKVVKKKPRIKKNRRNQSQFPALEKKYNLISRQSLIDFDYLEKLNDKEKRWLNKYVSEEVNADFRHKGHLNKSKKSKKVCYDRNNARNRCILVKKTMTGDVENISEVKQELNTLTPEEQMQQDSRIDVLHEIAEIVKKNQKLKEQGQKWYKKGLKPEEILEKLKKLDNFDNALNSADKSQKPA